jgi:glycosyltransferase involved in cell wall biosynthesis
LGTTKNAGCKEMKTLFIGHYKEGSGWSQATTSSILAANSVGLDIVCRNIKLTNYNGPIDKTILELENKDLKNIDCCIQNVLPHHIVGTQKFKKNIAYFVGESNTLIYTSWLTYLKLVDEVWVPNHSLKLALTNDGIDHSKISVIPYAFNLEKYKAVNGKINFTNNQYKFKFYYVGDLNDRKNIESIIRCFYSEFDNFEPVTLVLKVKKFGANDADLNKHVINLCNMIKKQLRIYNDVSMYNREIIIPGELSNEEIDILHSSCDCFINASHGEGWSIPAFDAMCFGKTPICSNEGGPKEFINEQDKNTGSLINGVYSVCDHSDPAFPDIFTGREEWFTPSESEMKKAMRYYYENRNSIDRTAGIKHAQKFSYESVGNLIKDAIYA